MKFRLNLDQVSEEILISERDGETIRASCIYFYIMRPQSLGTGASAIAAVILLLDK